MNISLFRPRLIIGPGRLGILEKLFKLIDWNLPVPMIGSGRNPYQFISVFDCAEAARLAWKAGVPNEAHSLVFVTEIRSGHVFADVDAPSMRIADGMTNNNLYEMDMSAAEGRDKEACVMVRILRDSASPTGWKLHAIGDYPDLSEVPDWGSYLTRYL